MVDFSHTDNLQVVEWFTEANANLTSTYGQTIPSLAFVHIPALPMRAFQKSGVSPTREPGINGERVQQQGYDSTTGYQSQDLPFIHALLNTTGLAATFSGHDHDNDWYGPHYARYSIFSSKAKCKRSHLTNLFHFHRCFKWNSKLSDLNITGNGMSMCYGRHTGYGGYGEWARGGRQILLNQQSLGDDVRTWIRMEDGSISGDVHLNATYGQDRYGLSQRRISEQNGGGLSPSPSYFGVGYLWIFVFYGLISRFHLW